MWVCTFHSLLSFFWHVYFSYTKINIKLSEYIHFNDTLVKNMEKKISVCRNGYKSSNDGVYQFIHSLTQIYTNIPNCPVPPGKYYIRNWVLDSKVFIGMSAASERTLIFNLDYCSKKKVPGVEPCWAKVVAKCRLKD